MSNRLNLLFSLGRPFSPLYGLAMKVRENCYARGLFRSHSLPVPVISVGNLVLGGTGKTPTVIYLAKLLQARGYRPAIISRGYRGKAKGRTNTVSDGSGILLDPRQAGDEPYMLARSLPGVPVLTGKLRLHPGRWAVEQLHADILILDDGFQHLALKRDIDLALFDGSTLAGNSRVFPGGVLREPVSALQRCSAFVLTGITEHNRQQAGRFGDLLRSRFGAKPVFYSSLGHYALRNPAGTAATASAHKVFFGFCGIANPKRFKESLRTMGIAQAGFMSLPDHISYSQTLVDEICARALAAGATHLVTTAKDHVKIERLRLALPLEILEIAAQHESAFDEFILKSIHRP